MNSQRGVSMVQAVIAAAVVMVTAFGVSRFATQTATTMKRVKDTPTIVRIGNIGLGNARKVLTDTGSNLTFGLCRILTTPVLTGGVGRINADLFSPRDDLFAADFNRAFPSSSWNSFSEEGSCEPNGYKRCFRPNSSVEGITKEVVKKLEPEVIIEMVPILVRSATGSAKNAIELPNVRGQIKQENARDVAFLIKATTRYLDENKKRKETSVRMSVWAGEMQCRYEVKDDDGNLTGDTVLINPSAIGSGLDDQTLFSSDNDSRSERLLRSEFPLSVRMESEVVVGTDGIRRGDSIRTDESMASIACNEQRFRCRDRTGTRRRWSNSLQGAFRLIFNRQNPLRVASNVEVRPTYNLQTKGGASISGATMTYIQGSNDLGNPARINIGETWSTILGQFSDGDNVCTTVCAEGDSTPYNNTMDLLTDSNIYFGVLRATMPQVQVDGRNYVETYTDTKPVACSCCFMKECGRRGVNVFGYCHKQPPEPLDSRLPECEGTSNLSERDNQLQDTTFSPTADSCVAGTVAPDGTIAYAVEPCANQHRVLCYFQGGYRFAQNPVNGNFPSVDFAGANRACHNMGREVLVQADLDNLLRGSGTFVAANMPPVTGGNYNFINNAAAGMFIAPQSPTNEAMAVGTITPLLRTSPTGAPEKFWVNLRTDRNNFLYAGPPEVPATVSQFSTHSDTGGVMFMNRDPAHSYARTTNDGAMLMNSRRYFGIMDVNADQTGQPARAAAAAVSTNPSTGRLVVSRNGFFQQEQARGNCALDGNVFVPLLTPTQWIGAMLRGLPNANVLNWPAPGPDAPLGTWLAMQRDGTRWKAKWPVTASEFDRTSRDFFTDNRRIYFIDGNGDPEPIAPASVSQAPVVPEWYLCRTGNPASPFEVKAYPDPCTTYFYQTNSNREWDVTVTRNVAMAIARSGVGLNNTTARIALREYTPIPTCVHSSTTYHWRSERVAPKVCSTVPTTITRTKTMRCDGNEASGLSWVEISDTCP